MNEKSLVPSIRFTGFTDAWERCKLGDLGKVRSGIGFPDAEQGGTEGLPFFKVSDMNISGNEHEMTKSQNYVSIEQIQRKKWTPILDVPAMFFAKVGAAVLLNRKRLCRTPFLLDNNTMAYSVCGEKWNVDFAKALFDTVNLPSLIQVGALPSYNAGDVESLEITLPNIEEQNQIGHFFRLLDRLITLHQRKYEKLLNIKKSMLDKMFPKNGELFPEVRFAGFTDAWERSKLGDLTDITTGKLDANAMSPDGEYDFYTCSLQVYKIDRYAFEGPAITVAGNGYVGCLHLADGKFNAYQRTYVLSNFKASREYLYAEIGNKLPEKVNQEARSGNIPYIVMDMLTDLEISLPCHQEQEQLAKLFTAVDRLITLHQRKLEKLQNIKKACLEKMFV